MSSVRLTDSRVLHIAGAPFVTDSVDTLKAPPAGDLAATVPLIPVEQLMPFATMLVRWTKKRRQQPRYAEVNHAQLRLAQLCIDRAISDEICAMPPCHEALARGVEEKTVLLYARFLKEAALMTAGARGVDARDMVHRDALGLVIALLSTDSPSRAVRRV